MDLFTLIHVLISIAGIAFGFIVLGGWIAGRQFRGWTAWFLIMTALTSITGFLFPIHGVTPGIVVGILSLILLAVALLAFRKRTVFVLCSLAALYLNFFVLVAQLFQHEPALKALAPTQSEPPFGITQGLVLVTFIVFGFAAVRGLRAAPVSH